MVRKMNTLLGVPYTGRGIGYTCGELVAHTPRDLFSPTLFAPYATADPRLGTVVSFAPHLLAKGVNKFVPGLARQLTEQRFRAAFDANPDAIAFLVGETTDGIGDWLAEKGIVTVREKLNSGKLMAKRILDEAYGALGVPPAHTITDADIERERKRLHQATYIFCPNAKVEESVREYGIADEKLIPTSYGFSAERLKPKGAATFDFKGPVFLFVGLLCVRKGVRDLFEAWDKADTGGTLVLAGNVEPVVREKFASYFDRDDVRHIDFVSDVGALYRSADVFVFPSLEEGGPQVTYEAAHCGLPSIVTPMGAGRIIHDGEEGFVVEPGAADQLADAMTKLAQDTELRGAMAVKSAESSKAFTWEKVAAQRAKALAERLSA